MMQYKTSSLQEAEALQNHWINQHKIFCTTGSSGAFYTCTTSDTHPFWREICDAFVAGFNAGFALAEQ
jgi:hypothetical protein